MSSIDSRVVEMKWDNSKFAPGAQSALSTLDKLKSALNLTGAAKGLKEVSDEASRFSLGKIGDGIQTLAGKFDALAIAGIAAITNIANRAVNAGIQIAKSLTIEPISAGFSEYELKMGSIQTILANTARHGTNLDQVTASLDKLNEYADKTIYNFGDMTRNIGLFTNAGLTIESSTSMIKGFSNVAAASGTSAQGAAGAAYQLSQALSAGTIRLMDWRSLSNVGMGNKNMQESIIQIAEAMGQFNSSTTSAEKAGQDFNGSLEKGWLSADVMSNYLQIMAGDMDAAAMSALGLSETQIAALQAQAKTAEEAATKVRTWTQLTGTIKESIGSSWAQTAELLVGDFDQATALFTHINDTLGPMIGAFGDARNQLLQGWSDGGGRATVIAGLQNAFDALVAVMAPVKEAFREIFPATTVLDLIKLSVQFKDFTAKLKPTEAALEKIKSIFKGLFAFVDIVRMVFVAVIEQLQRFSPAVSEGSSKIFDFAAKMGDWVVALRDSLKATGKLTAIFTSIGDALENPIRKVAEFVGKIKDLVKEFLTVEEGAEGISGVGDVFTKVLDKIQGAIDKLKPVFSGLWDGIKSGLGRIDINSLMTIFGAAGLGGAVFAVKKLIDSFKDANPVSGMLDSLKGALGGLTDTLSTMQTTLKATTLLAIAAAVALLAASLALLASIDAEKMTSALAAITVIFGQLLGAMSIFGKISGELSAGKLLVLGGGLILLAGAVLILSFAVKNLSGLEWDEIGRGLTGLAGVLLALSGAVQLMSTNTRTMATTGASLILLAIGVKILASAVKDLSGMSWEELGKGLTGVGGLLLALGLFTRFAEAGKGGAGQYVGILLLAVAIKMLVSVVAEFSQYSWEELAKGLGGLAVMLVALGGFTRLSDPSGVVKTAVAMVILGAAMHILHSAMAKFAGMSWEELGQGMTGLAGSLLIVAGAMQLMPKNMLVTAAALVAVAYALGLMADTIIDMSALSWEELAKGLVGLAGALLIVVGASHLMNGAIVGAVALSVLTAALSLFIPVLITLGETPISVLAIALGALVAVFLVLGVAAAALTPVIPSLMLLAVAMALMGAAAAALGIGLLAVGLGFSLFATALIALTAAGSGVVAMLSAIIQAIIDAIPPLMAAVGEGLVLLAKAIGDGAPAIIEALVAILLGLIEAVNTVVPPLLDALENLILLLLEKLETLIPQIVDSGMKVLEGFLKGIADNIGKVVDQATNIIVNFLDGITRNLPRIAESARNLIIAFIEEMKKNVSTIVPAATDLIVEFIEEIGNSANKITTAGTDTLIAFIEGIGNNASRLATAASNTIATFLEEIEKTIERDAPRIRSAAIGIATALIDGLTGGLASKVGNAVNKAKEVASSIVSKVKGVFGIASPSKVFHGFGVYLNEGLANGLSDSMSTAIRPATKVGEAVVSATEKALSGLSLHSTGALDIQPTIRPVMDLTSVRQGVREMDNLITPSNISSSFSGLTDIRPTDAAAVATAPQVQFIQHNTSPQALDAVEIFRQTNNQLSLIKEALPV